LARDIKNMIQLLYDGGIAAFFIVECLRNPYEIIYLRSVFANFFVISLFDRENSRLERYKNKAKQTWGEKYDLKMATETFEEAEKRDSGNSIESPKELLYKQNVTKCVQISDVSINNYKTDNQNRESIKLHDKVLRLVSLILSPGCTKPNNDEMWMNMAYAMAVKSNCISRQVGAVIIGPKGYMVGAGWNDVGAGKISCGLRTIRDLKIGQFKTIVEAIIREDERSAKEVIERLIRIHNETTCENPEQFCFCFKDEMVKKDVTPRLVKALYRKVEEAVEGIRSEKSEEVAKVSQEKFEEAEEFAKNTGRQILRELVEEGNLHQLEYCLALHAEENAIIQSSKIGGMGLKGGTIYTTAQPCPLCAKMIQQIGLRKVVYTEAYPESLSEVYMKGVDLEQFEGVKPRAYVNLFMPNHYQKDWQELESRDLVPVF